jgi:hypothetical protein
VTRRRLVEDGGFPAILAVAAMIGYILYVLLAAPSCGSLPFGSPHAVEAAEAAKHAAPFLPSPFNYVAEGVGLLLTYVGGHHVVRRVRKRRRAQSAANSASPR